MSPYTANKKSYQRHDGTASTKKITLSEKVWSEIAEKQAAIAKERGVKQVSLSVAFHEILNENDNYCYDPESFIEDECSDDCSNNPEYTFS